MAELEQEHPKLNTSDKKKISYENAVHPSHAKRAQKESPLIDLKTDITQKSLNFVEKFFSDSSANNSDNEQQPSSSHSKSRKMKSTQEQHHDDEPDGPSSLAQELPAVPEHLNVPLPAVREPLDTDDSRKEFDEHLSTIVSMFPNIEPGVCFMILQASEGRLPETIER